MRSGGSLGMHQRGNAVMPPGRRPPAGQCCNVALRQRGHAAMRRFTSGAGRSGAMLCCDAPPAGQRCNVTLRAAGELIFFGSSPVAPATSAATAAATSAAVAATSPSYEISRIIFARYQQGPAEKFDSGNHPLSPMKVRGRYLKSRTFLEPSGPLPLLSRMVGMTWR